MSDRRSGHHLRFQALVDLALDRPDPCKSVRELFIRPEHSASESQGQILNALFQEESDAFEGLILADYRRHRLPKCLAVEDEIFNFTHRSHLTKEQENEWISLLSRELVAVAEKAQWDTIDHGVALHAAKGLYFFFSSESSAASLHRHRKALIGAIEEVLSRSAHSLSIDTPLPDIELAAAACQLSNLFSLQHLETEIISLEPQVRAIVLRLQSDSCPSDNDERGNLELFSQNRDDFALFKLEAISAWVNLHATTVYTLIRQAHLESHAYHFLEILESTPCDSVFWPNVLQALAVCSPETLGEYLPTLIEKTIEDDDALACLFYVLALVPSQFSSGLQSGPAFNFDPVLIVAECLKTFEPNVREDFFEHADEVICDDKYRLYEIDHPEELLQRLRIAVEEDLP